MNGMLAAGFMGTDEWLVVVAVGVALTLSGLLVWKGSGVYKASVKGFDTVLALCLCVAAVAGLLWGWLFLVGHTVPQIQNILRAITPASASAAPAESVPAGK